MTLAKQKQRGSRYPMCHLSAYARCDQGDDQESIIQRQTNQDSMGLKVHRCHQFHPLKTIDLRIRLLPLLPLARIVLSARSCSDRVEQERSTV